MQFTESETLELNDMLHRIHLVEKWGSGMKIILEKEPSVTFEEAGRHFITTFKRKKVVETNLTNAPHGSEKSSVKSSEKILICLKEKPDMSADELAKRIGISSRAIEKHIYNLKEKGVLKRVGPDKGGHWEVTGKKE